MTENNENESDRRIRIDANNQNVPEISALAWEALIMANDPKRFFRYSSGLVRVEIDSMEGINHS
jgi:hypothetical protein